MTYGNYDNDYLREPEGDSPRSERERHEWDNADELHDKAREDRTEKKKMITCPDCDGDMEEMSACCGAGIDSDILICRACGEHSELAVCETCGGAGEIEDPNQLKIRL